MTALRLSTDGRFFVAPLCLVLAALVFAVTIPEFATIANAGNILAQMWVLALLAVGQMFALLTRGFDISVGSRRGAREHRRRPCRQPVRPSPRPRVRRRGGPRLRHPQRAHGRGARHPADHRHARHVRRRAAASRCSSPTAGRPCRSADGSLAARLAYETVLGLPPIAWIALILVIVAGLDSQRIRRSGGGS